MSRSTPIYPAPLQTGDTIGVFAPSSYVEKDDIEKSKAVMESRGYRVFIHPQTYERHHQSAGTSMQKALAFQGLWQRKDIDVIWAAGGGNRSLHLLDTINFKRLQDNPKHLIGFSDVTSLLNTVHAKTGQVTIHGCVFKNLHRHTEIDQLCNILEHKETTIPFSATVTHGTASGHLIGGNLSIFMHLIHTMPDDIFDNAILFFEDCNEELSKLDRMLWSLRHQGVLDKAAGIIFGEMSLPPETGRPLGFSLHDIIAEHVSGLDCPVVMDAAFGHGATLNAMPIGGQATLDTEQQQITIHAPPS